MCNALGFCAEVQLSRDLVDLPCLLGGSLSPGGRQQGCKKKKRIINFRTRGTRGRIGY